MFNPIAGNGAKMQVVHFYRGHVRKYALWQGRWRATFGWLITAGVC
ncbi:MAG: hypothetical protein O2983_12885 [Planctomycetota bacterium]|nr:hypothetical protein [Planctomycetota bacterium]MDA1160495.1 hypothetical protein [Planctomycetota bacterium]